MRLPRRVPWASIAELDQVCAAIFTDESDVESKNFAINRLSAWKAVTELPHALESTLALLVVVVQDNSSLSRGLMLRQSYASALIRLVNGLVDPMQLGVYARSIAAIAAQLGIPLWLVELRHAATHEDLPSLELLREGARQSMSWLLHNYWLPTLNPSTSSIPEPNPLRPLEPILKEYKSLLKLTTRDASLKKQYKQTVALVFKDVEKWIAEAAVAANVATGELGWNNGHQTDSTESGRDMKERWALEAFSDVLLEKGGLVPLSKKKRAFQPDSFSPSKALVQIWEPLLAHIQVLHPDFLSILVTRALSRLLNVNPPADLRQEVFASDPSYDMLVSRWIVWVIDRWDANEDADADEDVRADTVASLISALSPGSEQPAYAKKNLNALLSALCASSPNLSAALTALSPTELVSASASAVWTPQDVAIMQERLEVLLSFNLENEQPASAALDEVKMVAAPGWSLLNSNSGWRACPIGIPCTPIHQC